MSETDIQEFNLLAQGIAKMLVVNTYINLIMLWIVWFLFLNWTKYLIVLLYKSKFIKQSFNIVW